MSRLVDLGLVFSSYAKARLSWRMSNSDIEAAQRRGIARNPRLTGLLGSSTDEEPLQAVLDRLPLTDASALRTSFDRLNRLGVSLDEARARAAAERAGCSAATGGYSFGLSTGSAGEPGVFITSASERSAYAGNILGKLLSPGELLGLRVALLLKNDNRLYRHAARPWLFSVSHFDIASPLSSWIERLLAEEPDILIGPPSVLVAVAENERFASQPLRPRMLLTGAEPTFPSDSCRLEQAYGAAPRQIYQASEGFIAIACRFGTLHVNEDRLVAEWCCFENDPTRAAPVITDFSRRTQDVWRTRLTDVIRLRREPCPCGAMLQGLTCVEGRFSDVFYASRGDRNARGGAPSLVFPFTLDAILADALPVNEDWRIGQAGIDSLVVSTARRMAPLERKALRERLFEAGGWSRVEWEKLAPRPLQVKRRRFTRTIDLQSQLVLQSLGPPRLRRC